jgi:hypothetical protein
MERQAPLRWYRFVIYPWRALYALARDSIRRYCVPTSTELPRYVLREDHGHSTAMSRFHDNHHPVMGLNNLRRQAESLPTTLAELGALLGLFAERAEVACTWCCPCRNRRRRIRCKNTSLVWVVLRIRDGSHSVYATIAWVHEVRLLSEGEGSTSRSQRATMYCCSIIRTGLISPVHHPGSKICPAECVDVTAKQG